jgi:phenylpyruvate tautomerase PptA (4-oxalocrotonate tautomerase family)
MPYVNVNVSAKLGASEKEQLKAKMGEVISLIPGKTEAVTMVSIADGCALYLGGKPLDKGAFIETRIYGTAEKADKEKYIKAVFAAMKDALGYPADGIYINILEFDSWGAGGGMI